MLLWSCFSSCSVPNNRPLLRTHLFRCRCIPVCGFQPFQVSCISELLFWCYLANVPMALELKHWNMMVVSHGIKRQIFNTPRTLSNSLMFLHTDQTQADHHFYMFWLCLMPRRRVFVQIILPCCMGSDHRFHNSLLIQKIGVSMCLDENHRAPFIGILSGQNNRNNWETSLCCTFLALRNPHNWTVVSYVTKMPCFDYEILPSSCTALELPQPWAQPDMESHSFHFSFHWNHYWPLHP